jgi:ribosome-binding factor A
MTPVQKLLELNEKKQQEVEAEIQKKLTKAVPFFRGKMCQSLGLRYAPEIRFYKDNSLSIIRQHKKEAAKYIEDQAEEEAREEENDPRR